MKDSSEVSEKVGIMTTGAVADVALLYTFSACNRSFIVPIQEKPIIAGVTRTAGRN